MEKKKIDRIIEAFRNYIYLKEDSMVIGPTNSVGGGKIAGTPQSDPGNPPVDLRKGRRRYWNPFFKNLANLQRRKHPKI